MGNSCCRNPVEDSGFNVAKSHEVNVVLDVESAHPNLRISEDGKTVQWSDQVATVTTNSQRFDDDPYVLGHIGRAWRAYWEVSVEKKDDWVLGVARVSAGRKGQLVLSPNNGYWVMRLSNRQRLKVMSDEERVLPVDIPGIVGIFLDYKERKVTFFNVEKESLIHEFSDGPGYSDEVSPLFSPWNNDANPVKVLSITCKTELAALNV